MARLTKQVVVVEVGGADPIGRPVRWRADPLVSRARSEQEPRSRTRDLTGGGSRPEGNERATQAPETAVNAEASQPSELRRRANLPTIRKSPERLGPNS